MSKRIIMDEEFKSLVYLMQRTEFLGQSDEKMQYTIIKDSNFILCLMHWLTSLTQIVLRADTKFQEIESRLEKIEQKLDQ